MPEMTRRSFLKQGGTTAAAAGAVVATPKVFRSPAAKKARPAAARTTTAAARKAASDRALVVHIPDTRHDEVRILVADREVVVHDSDLVARLRRAAD